MQVDLRIPSSKPVAEIVSFAQRCEDAGFSGLGFVDSHTFLRDVYVVMAQVLQNTERIRVRPAVICPGPRHTSVIASVAKTVQELGPGRYELQAALVDKVAVAGDPDSVTKRMKELEDLGVDHIYLYPAESFSLPEHELRAFKEVIGPAFNLSP